MSGIDPRESRKLYIEENTRLRAEIERLTRDADHWRRVAKQVAEQGAAEIERLMRENRKLRSLVRAMLENDPSDLAADGGITVLQVWRKDAAQALTGKDG